MSEFRGDTIEEPQVSEVFLPPEIWVLVGEKIASRKTLLDLVLVCRKFRAIFEPILYAEYRINLSFRHAHSPSPHRIPPGLRYTKDFHVMVSEFCECGIKYKKYMNKNYAAQLVLMINSMSNLQSFSWVDCAFEDDHGPNKIVRDSKLVKSLSKHDTLKSLSIVFELGYLDNETPAVESWIPLGGFSNLTSLSLLNFYGRFGHDRLSVAIEIAELLGRCPSLKSLSLGVACDCDCDSLPEAVLMKPSDDPFLKEICVGYAAQRHVRPLRLHTLRLGWGMCVYSYVGEDLDDPSEDTDTEYDKPPPQNFLRKLVDLSSLRSLEIFNGLHRFETGLEEEDDLLDVEWDMFNDCKMLQRLTISEITTEVREWLLHSATGVKELIISGRLGASFDAYRRLLPQLSMIYTTRESVARARRHIDEDDDEDVDVRDGWEDTDSDVADVDGEPDLQVEQFPTDPAEAILAIMNRRTELVEMGSQKLDGLKQTLAAHDETHITDDTPQGDKETVTSEVVASPSYSSNFVDYLTSAGPQLSRLGFHMSFEKDMEKFLSHLPKLSNLTQLRLDTSDFKSFMLGNSGRPPKYTTGMWGDMRPVDVARDSDNKCKSVALSYVKLFHSKCLSLQFVRIYDWAWQIITTSSADVEFYEMNRAETISVELFAFDAVNLVDGLLVTRLPMTWRGER